MTVLVPASLARIDNRSLRCAARGRVVVADRKLVLLTSAGPRSGFNADTAPFHEPPVIVRRDRRAGGCSCYFAAVTAAMGSQLGFMRAPLEPGTDGNVYA